MAKTYGDLILEYENYPHSKECFELMKECYEITLMEQYVESQQFMIDNVVELKESYNEFDESYFIEAADEEAVKAVKSSATEKVKGFFKKVWEKIVKAWQNLCGFFRRIGDKFITSKKNMDKVAERLENANKDDLTLDMEFYQSAINNAWPQSYLDDGFDITCIPSTEIAKGFHILIDNITGSDTKQVNAVKNRMKAALATNGVRVKLISKSAQNKMPRVTTADKAVAYQFNFQGEGINPAMLQKMIDGIVVSKNYVDIDFSEAGIDKLVKQMKSVEGKLRGLKLEEGSNVPSPEIMNCYKDLLAIFADTMKMYNYVAKYRSDVTAKIVASLSGAAKAADKKGKEEKPKEEPKEEPKTEE